MLSIMEKKGKKRPCIELKRFSKRRGDSGGSGGGLFKVAPLSTTPSTAQSSQQQQPQPTCEIATRHSDEDLLENRDFLQVFFTTTDVARLAHHLTHMIGHVIQNCYSKELPFPHEVVVGINLCVAEKDVAAIRSYYMIALFYEPAVVASIQLRCPASRAAAFFPVFRREYTTMMRGAISELLESRVEPFSKECRYRSIVAFVEQMAMFYITL